MKKHKVGKIIMKQAGCAQAVFKDGGTMFVPHNLVMGLYPSMRVYEHINKNGITVAYSWTNHINFVAPQPLHFDNAVTFIEKFRFFDRVRFNNAIMDVLHYRNSNRIFPDTEKFAHNLVLYGIKCKMY